MCMLGVWMDPHVGILHLQWPQGHNGRWSEISPYKCSGHKSEVPDNKPLAGITCSIPAWRFPAQLQLQIIINQNHFTAQTSEKVLLLLKMRKTTVSHNQHAVKLALANLSLRGQSVAHRGRYFHLFMVVVFFFPHPLFSTTKTHSENSSSFCLHPRDLSSP